MKRFLAVTAIAVIALLNLLCGYLADPNANPIFKSVAKRGQAVIAEWRP